MGPTAVRRRRCSTAHRPRTSADIRGLLLAVEILQSPGHTIERVAHSLEFPSGSAFRNLCRRYLGHRPAELRSSAGREAAYRAFKWSLEMQRPPATQAREARSVAAAVGIAASASDARF